MTVTTGDCQKIMYNEGYGMNSRLTILTGTFSYLDDETHTAEPTLQGHNSSDLGAHAPLGLDKQKNDHLVLRSIYVFVLLGVARAIPVGHFWADFTMPATGVRQFTMNGQ